MKNIDLARPHGHADSCSCRACLNIIWLAAHRPNNAPVPLPVVHAANCGCPTCRHPAERRMSLIARFRRAAEPGDWAALGLGLALGSALFVVAIAAHEWDAILAFVGAR